MKNLKQTLMYTRKKKGVFISGFLLLLISVVTDLIRPFLIQTVLDDVIIPSVTGSLAVSFLWTLLASFLALTIVAAAGRYVSFLLLTKGANSIVKQMRDDLYEHVQQLPIRYFDDLPAGKVVSQITNDTEQLRIFYVVFFGQVLPNLVYIIGIYMAMLRINVVFGVVALILVPIFWAWSHIYQKYAQVYTVKLRELIGDINAKLNESIQGMSIIQSFQQETHIRKEFSDVNEEWYMYSDKFIKLDSLAAWSFVSSLKNVALVFLLVTIGIGTMEGTFIVSVGVLYLMVDYTTRLFNPIQGIINQWAYLQQALTSAGRVFELMAVPIEKEETASFSGTRGDVVFEDVSFAYEADTYVLHSISFTAKKGQTIALVGHTGSGKSSIMNLLFRFYDPTRGRITVDGVDITQVSRKSVREQMGIVLQDPYLFKGTLGSNIRLGEQSISDETILEALRAVGGEALLSQFPGGLDHPVVDKGSTLSSGQRQLISFARALAFDPTILILDEATSHIDTETEELIQHAMDVVKRGRTTFVIAHRLSTIQHADVILVLEKGRIVEQGTHTALMRQNGQYAHMFRTQAEKSA